MWFFFHTHDVNAARVIRNVQATHIYRTYSPLTLTAGTTYEFKTEAAAGVDPFMYLLDASNAERAYNDDVDPPSNLNSFISYTPPSTDLFYIVVRSYSTYSAGAGHVYYRVVGGDWIQLTTGTGSHFGGIVLSEIESDQNEYRTAMVNTDSTVGATPDTVLYPMWQDWFGHPQIQGFSDDEGVGFMSAWVRPPGLGVTHVLVGAYSAPGKTDVFANDAIYDDDGDGLGPGLEAELGTCDSPSTSDVCPGLINYQDSDHDGLSDLEEVFGVDYPADMKLPRFGGRFDYATSRRTSLFSSNSIGLT